MRPFPVLATQPECLSASLRLSPSLQIWLSITSSVIRSAEPRGCPFTTVVARAGASPSTAASGAFVGASSCSFARRLSGCSTPCPWMCCSMVLDGSLDADRRAKSMLHWDVYNGVCEPEGGWQGGGGRAELGNACVVVGYSCAWVPHPPPPHTHTPLPLKWPHAVVHPTWGIADFSPSLGRERQRKVRRRQGSPSQSHHACHHGLQG
jgi:hypothetical protein